VRDVVDSVIVEAHRFREAQIALHSECHVVVGLEAVKVAIRCTMTRACPRLVDHRKRTVSESPQGVPAQSVSGLTTVLGPAVLVPGLSGGIPVARLDIG